MANTTTIILKNSGTTGNTPTAANLQFGELALNYADGLLFYKSSNGTVLSISGSGGGGESGNGSAAFDQANVAYTQANLAFDKANSANIIADSAFSRANAAVSLTIEVFNKANTTNVTVDAAFARANAANLIANLAFDKANTANIIASAAFDAANAAGSSTTVTAAFDKANIANITADSAFAQANIARTHTNGAFDQANTARTHANGAHITANAAYDFANTRFSSNGGTISGDVSISGNLIVIGNSTVFNVSSLVINDPLIFLANNNYSSDLVDIGFVGHYNDGVNAHTGFVRDAESKEYYVFNGYTPEVFANDVINIAHPSFALTNINANYYKGNLIADTISITTSAIVSGINLIPTIASSFTTANAAFGSQNATSQVANAAFDQANTARTHANGAFGQANVTAAIANSAFDKANSANITADAAFAKANVANVIADSSFVQANIARTHANGAFANANSAGIIASAAFDAANAAGSSATVAAAFDKANVANITADSAFARANAANLIANLAFDKANTANIIASGAYDKANTANITVDAAFARANAANLIANLAFDKANTANITADAAFGRANTANITADAAFARANDANLIANLAFDKANTANITADSAFARANAANLIANLAFDKANTANVIASGAYDKANIANITACAAFAQANTANTTSVAAFAKANAAFPSTGGTISGDVFISGNLTVVGNSTVFNVSSLVVNDPLIFLGNNNYSSDLVDIGFVGHYNDGVNAHTGFVRDATSKEYFIFNGYTPEIFANDIINIAHPSFALTNINANYYKGNLIANTVVIAISSTVAGVNIVPTLSSAFDKANTANITADAAFARANAANLVANLAYDKANTANVFAIAAFAKANIANITADSAFARANDANLIANLAFDKANTANITADSAFARANAANLIANLAYDKANTANVIASASFDRANSQANLAFKTVVANGTSLVATSNADTLTIGTTGNVSITADAAGDNMTFDLTTTGVTAATYGSDTIVPVLSVDSRGRITSVSNVTISTTGGSSSNSFVYVSDSPPANVANGFLWWQSNTGSLYIRYGDGDSSQWVATQQQGIGGGATFSQPAANAIAQSPTQLLASANGLTYTSSTFSTAGDASVKKYMLIGTTTNATPLRLLHGGGNGLIPVGTNTTIQYNIDISARRTDAIDESAGWTLKGVVDNFSGTVADVGLLYEIVVARDDANYVVDALANNTSKSLDIMVTGVNTKTIRWVAFVQTVEVSQ